MSEEFIIKRVRRRRKPKNNPNSSSVIFSTSSTSTPAPVPCEPNCTDRTNIHVLAHEESLPKYLVFPPETPDGVSLRGNHTKELVCAFRVAKEVLGSSFRPNESNLAVGKIRV